ncbi:Cupin domain-containing protein [Blastococcus sp. DSM 46786]|uniref:cupin domain-containing protein n=1 Tax=Blastococcus sp. DSM 46786 TaxID=1798227 RepID=UPI0008BB0F02|nr:cupin domain-containing protein [Blastococcus sp. DSM 46786]SEL53861.1 Cupin domain-containing protein [Blastococcus sp. DSM 46786]
MTIVRPGAGPQLTALGSTYTTKADGSTTGGAYWLVEEEFWAETTPLHSHTAAEESFYVLSGRAAMWLEGEETEAVPGTFLLVPRGRPHALRRLGDEPVRMLTLVSPAGMERFFRAVVEQGEDGLLADPERLTALAESYGTRILGDHPGP